MNIEVKVPDKCPVCDAELNVFCGYNLSSITTPRKQIVTYACNATYEQVGDNEPRVYEDGCGDRKQLHVCPHAHEIAVKLKQEARHD